MWLLSCDGDLFSGKRFWLRPGSIHLLGRTTGQPENGERIRHIDHKSVSRKHLTIEVPQVGVESVSRIFTKTQLRLRDGSKIGTTVNGDKIKGEEKVLEVTADKRSEYTVKLGSYEHQFHLVWLPVVLSLPSTGKKAKEAAAATQTKFHGTDVKVVLDYVVNTTTHYISKKRNTPAALQALLQAKWLVTEEYVDAVLEALDRGGPDRESSLEADFDLNWPTEEDYIVPSGTEPNPRPNELLKPDPARSDVFSGFTFVFLLQSQHDTLLPVITAGGGKALVYDANPETTKPEDAVQYIREVAGAKQPKQFKLSQQAGKGGVVVVRANERDEAGRVFMRSINRALDQRSIEQNELLDPILTLDTTGLRQQLPEPSQASVADSEMLQQSQHGGNVAASHVHPHSNAQEEASQPAVATQSRDQAENSYGPTPPAEPNVPEVSHPTAEPAAPEREAPAKKRTRRFITQSRFQGFDDFDPSQFAKPASQSPERTFEPQFSQAQSAQEMDVDEPSQAKQASQSTRKRAAPLDEEEDEEDMYASMLTAHNTMKRRKLAAGQNADPKTVQTEADRRLAEKAARAKKKAKEIDVMGEIQARRQREDEEYRKNEEALREALDGVDIKDLKNLAKVEEIDVPVRERPSRGDANGNQANDRSDRWDPAWNGRKNFKKFRRQGHRDGDAPRLPRVMVALEEVPRKGHGIGDEYWLTTTTSNRSKSKSQSQSQSQATRRSQQEAFTADTNDTTGSDRFMRRLLASRQQDEENADRGGLLPFEIAGHARDEGLEAIANSNASGIPNSTASQTQATESQRRAAGKRSASEAAGGPAKRAKQSRSTTSSTRETVTIFDDGDDDGLKFRRRRR